MRLKLLEAGKTHTLSAAIGIRVTRGSLTARQNYQLHPFDTDVSPGSEFSRIRGLQGCSGVPEIEEKHTWSLNDN